MIPDNKPIYAALVRAGYHSCDVHCFATLESTSQWLNQSRRSLANQISELRPQICITDWQQAGVGRRGKNWQSAQGNITVSMLASIRKPAGELMGLSLVTGIAVVEALAEYFDLAFKLKWPNDIILGEHKLGGLLTEIMGSSAEGGGSGHGHTQQVITGIGINLLQHEQTATLGIGGTSLQQAGYTVNRDQRDALVGEICAAVLEAHDQFLLHSWAAFEERWQAMDWLYDREITIHRENSTEHARACGVNEQGALLIERAGHVQPLYGGNVSIRPTA